MKIRLDEKEIVAIITEWAMMTHKSKNVSGMFQIDVTPEVLGPRGKLLEKSKVNFIYVDLDVIVGDGEYNNASSAFGNAAITRAKQAMAQSQSTLTNNSPAADMHPYAHARHVKDNGNTHDFTPNFNSSAPPL